MDSAFYAERLCLENDGIFTKNDIVNLNPQNWSTGVGDQEHRGSSCRLQCVTRSLGLAVVGCIQVCGSGFSWPHC